MSPIRQVQAALDTARELPGWNVSRLDGGSTRVTSPSGMYLVPANPRPDTVQAILAELDRLGLQHDLQHRPITAPPTPAAQPLTTETEPAVPTATSTAKRTSKPKPRDKARPIIAFDYPDQPQIVPLSQLLPDAYSGRGRVLLPKVVINAEIAEALYNLRAEDNNRRLRPSNRRKFKRLIQDGAFEHTHQGMAFNVAGQCSDGQHRMAALLDVCRDDPGTTLVVDITFNAPVTSATAYDGGANRTNVDRLNVAGFDRANVMGPLVRLLYLYEEIQDQPRSWKEVAPLDQATLIEWADRYGEDLLESYDAVRTPLRGLGANLKVAGVCHYLALQEWDESPIDKFIEALAERTLQYRDSPQRALTTWWRTNERQHKTVSQQTHLAMFLVAYNDFCQGLERKGMKWIPGPDGRLPYAYSPGSD